MKKKTIKTIFSIFFAVVLLTGITACGKTIGTGGDKPADGVIQVTGSASMEMSTSKEDTTAKEDATKETTTAAGVDGNQHTSNAGGNNSGSGNGASNGNAGGGAVIPDHSTQTPTEAPTQAPTQPPTEAPTQPPAPTWTIYVTVDAGPYGGIFGGGTFTYYYQPTAFDALTATGLPYTGSSYYVSSINGLAEFDHGRMSGWLYAVNGVEPSVGCGSYYLNDGDSVYWHYQGDE